MGKVQLKIPPWVASVLNGQASDWFTLEQEIGDTETVSDLLTELALNDDDFRKTVFNPDVGKISEQINVFLNDSLLQFPDVNEKKLSDGDSIMLLPVFSGG